MINRDPGLKIEPKHRQFFPFIEWSVDRIDSAKWGVDRNRALPYPLDAVKSLEQFVKKMAGLVYKGRSDQLPVRPGMMLREFRLFYELITY